MNNFIDLRSDTVTKPSKDMLQAMINADVGDDVYKEDPTVNRLEKFAAELLGKEDALFVPSGTMANQICLNVLTSPGDEVICERNSHIFHYESGSPAALSGLSLNLIDGTDGVITADQVEAAIRPQSAYYMARTRVIEIENTHNVAGGIIQPIGVIKGLQEVADKNNLFMHLDGARIWNASVETKIQVSEYCSFFDSVSCCLSKGLGAPIGSIIAGTKDFIKEAYRLRKAWGGGMRQAGVIAAAGFYALEHNIERLAEDHQKAKDIALFLSELQSVEMDSELVQTNMFMFKPLNKKVDEVIRDLRALGMLVGPGGAGVVRIVTHMDISDEDIKKVKEILLKVLG